MQPWLPLNLLSRWYTLLAAAGGYFYLGNEARALVLVVVKDHVLHFTLPYCAGSLCTRPGDMGGVEY